MNTELSQSAKDLIRQYLRLPIGIGCNCPYFNNRRSKVRGGLRSIVGKGNPKDISDEAEILSLREKKNIKSYSGEDLKKFLVEQKLGIDCSGLAFHVLDTEARARNRGKLSRSLYFPGNILKQIYYRLRPAENMNVERFAIDKNSVEIEIENVRAGDVIIFIGTGPHKTYNHILVVTDVRGTTNDRIISYVHSYAWPSDGKYGHGVRVGEIRATDLSVPITKALWTEKEMSGKDNYTLQSACDAQSVHIRRLKALIN
jgi:hypothetical protein